MHRSLGTRTATHNLFQEICWTGGPTTSFMQEGLLDFWAYKLYILAQQSPFRFSDPIPLSRVWSLDQPPLASPSPERQNPSPPKPKSQPHGSNGVARNPSGAHPSSHQARGVLAAPFAPQAVRRAAPIAGRQPPRAPLPARPRQALPRLPLSPVRNLSFAL